MAALVAVMILVSVSTFDWHSIKPSTLKLMPKGESIVMAVTVAGTVATHNLAIGVAAGVLTSMAVFARRVSRMVEVTRVVDPEGSSALYSVSGELFFASDQELIDAFNYREDPPSVVIDFSRAHLWDYSAVAALDAIATHYERHGIRLEVTGLNGASERLHRDLTGQLVSAH